MKYLLTCALLCMVLCNIAGLPQVNVREQQPDVSENDHPHLLHPIIPPHIPEVQSRVTCDVLSFLGVNHAACAAHCIYLRYRGGYCNERRVCVCRS